MALVFALEPAKSGSPEDYLKMRYTLSHHVSEYAFDSGDESSFLAVCEVNQPYYVSRVINIIENFIGFSSLFAEEGSKNEGIDLFERSSMLAKISDASSNRYEINNQQQVLMPDESVVKLDNYTFGQIGGYLLALSEGSSCGKP